MRPKENQFALLENGDVSFAVRAQLLEQAKKSIRIQALIFAGDESGLYLAEILKRKKAEGLDVRVIVDATANLGLQTQWMYFDLKQHGIEVQGYESLYLEWLNEVPIPFLSPAKDPEAPNSRYHEKMWIVDGETENGVAVVGGLNVANEYFRVDPSEPDDFWRDQDVIVRGPMVADMVTAFERNYQHFLDIKESRGALNTDHYWEATRDFLDTVGQMDIPYMTDPDLVERVAQMARLDPVLKYVNARGRFFQNRPRLGETYIQQAYQKLFENAQQEIIICNAYFIPSAEFINAVRDVVSRGLQVIILSNSPETNDLPELSMVGRNYYKYILAINEEKAAQAGGGSVQIWEWYGWRFDEDRQTQGTIHAKYAVFDRRYSLIGSYNLDPRSEKLNSETAVVIESKELSTDLARIFYENDLAYSRKVSLRQQQNSTNRPMLSTSLERISAACSSRCFDMNSVKSGLYALIISFFVCLAAFLPATSCAFDSETESVIILHGYGRTTFSMRPLQKSLEEAGFIVYNIGYPSISRSPPELVEILDARLKSLLPHSAAHPFRDPFFRRYSGAGLPGRESSGEHGAGGHARAAQPGDELADIANAQLLRAILGPTVAQLGTGEDSLPNRLPPPWYELGVIPGIDEINPVGNLFVPDPSDGTVSVVRTRLEGMSDFVTVRSLTHLSCVPPTWRTMSFGFYVLVILCLQMHLCIFTLIGLYPPQNLNLLKTRILFSF